MSNIFFGHFGRFCRAKWVERFVSLALSVISASLFVVAMAEKVNRRFLHRLLSLYADRFAAVKDKTHKIGSQVKLPLKNKIR